MTHREYFKTDRNGTKYYYVTCPCGKCGGRGIIDCYIPINGGDCFDCGGTGVLTYEEKEYTPEYEAKLEERRQKREAKRLAKLQAELPQKQQTWLEKNGFNSDGKTYLFLGNTYEMKEDIKAVGGKFDYSLGWHIAEKVNGYQFLEISVEEVADFSMFDGWVLDPSKCVDLKSRCRKAYQELNPTTEHSEYVGEIGDKIEIEVTYVHTSSWENGYGGYWNEGVTNLHTFKDANGNVFIWKTGKYIEADYGTKLKLTGTIKDHSEYKDTKQTVLTRCKAIA